ncbi:MAG: response regulator transcription factor [Geobacteraceae bacterium]
MVFPILIVEDDPKIANVVRVYLENDGYRVTHAEKGRDALVLAGKEHPLLVVLDLMLPDMSGEDVCQELKEMGDIPVIMLTSKSSEEERLAGFALGADDYVVKPFSPRELLFRVKAVLKRSRREDLEGTSILNFNDGELALDGQTYQAIWKGETVSLTPTEFKVLFTLASTPQKIFTREELVQKALGYNFEGYERSIDAHIKNIRQKIGDDSRHPTYIQTIYGVGYRFSGRKDV